MSKRLTDTNKWRKPFIKGLPTSYKLFWLYLLDECDHAGIWQVEVEIAEIRTGEKFKQSEALELFKEKIHVFDDGEKWFIPDFVEFQYGQLNPSNRAHNSVISLLSKYSLLNKIKPLVSPLQGAKDKDKVKVKDKDKRKRGEFEGGTRHGRPMTQKQIMEFYEAHGRYPK